MATKSRRATIFGIIMGLIMYAVYIMIFKRIPSTLYTNTFSIGKEPSFSALPEGVSASQACQILKSHYKAGVPDKTDIVNPSALVHWNNLGCQTLLIKDDVEIKVDPVAVPQSLPINPEISQETHKKSYFQSLFQKPPLSVPDSSIEAKVISSGGDGATRDKEWCVDHLKSHSVVPGSSWGSLPVSLQREWTKRKCDEYVEIPAAATNDEPNTFGIIKTDGDKPAVVGKAVSTSGLPKISSESSDWCAETKRRYHVQPMKSWGTLPMNMIETWKTHNCDRVFTVERMKKVPITACSPEHLHNKTLPLIALMAATTTRKVTNPSTNNLALFSYLLPSLLRTVDCGYKYIYVLGYDQGDPFYDSPKGLDSVKAWFQENVEKPMKKNNIFVSLHPVRVNNDLKKPGPVFNAMARAAYAAGASYFYRVNDDTELVNHWPKVFVKALHSLSVPHGVVGPTCHQGNQKILTHDFTHRLHMDVFEMNYYPPQLADWWMDDWISLVYGQQRTFKASRVTVLHHTGAHGQRYTVDRENEKYLTTLVEEGRKSIRKWMLKHGVDSSALKDFDSDRYTAGFDHHDVRNGVYS